MDLSIFVIRIAAILFLVIGLAGLINKNYYQKMVRDAFKNKGTTLVLGLVILIVSFIIVSYHNVWNSNWTVLVTLIGWLGMIKGITILLFPTYIEKFSMKIFKGKLVKIIPYTTIIIGLIFGYLGYF